MFGLGDELGSQEIDEPDLDQQNKAKREATKMSKIKVPEDKLMEKFKKKAEKIGKKPRNSKKKEEEKKTDNNQDSQNKYTYETFKLIWENSTFTYLLLAAFLSIMGRYALLIWGQKYFDAKYPDKEEEFSVIYSLILTFGAVPSQIYGGYLESKFSQKSETADDTKAKG